MKQRSNPCWGPSRTWAAIAIAFTCGAINLRGADLSANGGLEALDIVAVDKRGEPVQDLRSEELRVMDAGKRRELSFFNHRGMEPWNPSPLGPNEFSNRVAGHEMHATLILLDLLNQDFSTQANAFLQLEHNLDSFGSLDSLYVYVLSADGTLVPVREIPFELHFQSSSQQGWTSGQLKPLLDDVITKVTGPRRASIDSLTRVETTYSALSTLALQLSRVPGRKNIVWITNGIPLNLDTRWKDATGNAINFTEQLRRLSQQFYSGSVSLYPVRQVFNTALNNVASEATLDEFAGETGGRTNAGPDIGEAVRQAMRDVLTSYQIGYFEPARNWDGKFHKIRVTCTRSGVRIQARTGYMASLDAPGRRPEEVIDSAARPAFDATGIGLHAILTRDSPRGSASHIRVRINAQDIVLAKKGDHFDGHLQLAIAGYLESGRTAGQSFVSFDLQLSYTERDRQKALVNGVQITQAVTTGPLIKKVRLIVFDHGSGAVGSLTIPMNGLAKNQGLAVSRSGSGF